MTEDMDTSFRVSPGFKDCWIFIHWFWFHLVSISLFTASATFSWGIYTPPGSLDQYAF